MSIIKNLFRYPADMGERIRVHEENILELYSNIIAENYKDFFESLGYILDVALFWECSPKKIFSKSRIDFGPAYSCSVICEVKKDGNLVRIPARDGEVDYYPLCAVWEISKKG